MDVVMVSATVMMFVSVSPSGVSTLVVIVVMSPFSKTSDCKFIEVGGSVCSFIKSHRSPVSKKILFDFAHSIFAMWYLLHASPKL
jgi:hypothetical protein